MTFETILTILATLGAGGLISGLLLRKLAKIEHKQDKRESASTLEGVLIICGLRAVGNLAQAVAIAQKAGETNGKTDTALKNYTTWSEKMTEFLIEQNAKNIHGG